MRLTPRDIRQIRDHMVDAIRGISAVMIEASSREDADAKSPPAAGAPSAPYPVPNPRPEASNETGPRLTYTIAEAGRVLSLGRSTIYKLISSGELQAIRIGSRRLIPARAIDALLSRQ